MVPIDDISVSGCHARLSKHRSCWLHAVANAITSANGEKKRKSLTKEQAEDLRIQELFSPCILNSFPFTQRKRTERKTRPRNLISLIIVDNRKLDCGAFDRYFSILWENFSKEKKDSIAVIDSVWFNMYFREAFCSQVVEWVQKKQIFSKKYVLLPIVLWSHWNLLILCNLGEKSSSKNNAPCMLLLDSLASAEPRRYEQKIRQFLSGICEHEGVKLEGKLPLLIPEVPQQRDDIECGRFVLHFMDLFVRDAPEEFDINEYPYFMTRNWFAHDNVDRFFRKLVLMEKSLG